VFEACDDGIRAASKREILERLSNRQGVTGMKTVIRWGAAAVAFFLSMGIAGAANNRAVRLDLARDGTPAATIVLAKEPTRSAQLAAAELQYHIRRISGATLPIVDDGHAVGGNQVLVGESQATRNLGLTSADFAPQEYLIRFQPGALVLLGRDKPDRARFDYGDAKTFPDVLDEQSTCYAVYDFLERHCQVRWYLPTELGLVCPKAATLTVSGADIRRSPHMKYRSVADYPFPADLCGDTVYGPNPQPALPRREQLIFYHRHRLGGDKYKCNHSLYGYYDRFLSTHREWFAQGYDGRPPQMCYTNPEFVKQVIQDARDHFDGKPAQPGEVSCEDSFAVVPMDGNRWCKCANCRALLGRSARRVLSGGDLFANDSASEYIFSFINAVAKEIRKSHLKKRLAALAYCDYAYPPATLKLEPNVSVQICMNPRSIEALFVQENNSRILREWVAESKDRRKYLWLYYCFPALEASLDKPQWRCFPSFFAHSIPNQMKAYVAAGIRGLFYEPSYLAGVRSQSPLMDQIEFYVTWKLADDPNLDGTKLIDEFFTRYYGAAAKPMQAVYELIEKTYGEPEPAPERRDEQHSWTKLGTEKTMAELGKLMDEARKSAYTDIEKERVALFDKGIWHYMRAGRKAYLQKIGLPADKSAAH
jgi:hypothetical protein